MIITGGRRKDSIQDPVRKVGTLGTIGNTLAQGLEEGYSSFVYTSAWLNNKIVDDEESKEWLDLQKERKLDVYNRINAFEQDQDYGMVAGTLLGISRGVVGGMVNPFELATGKAGGVLAKGLTYMKVPNLASTLIGDTLLDTAYNASVSEGMLQGDYGFRDFTEDLVNGAVFAGVLRGGSALLGSGYKKAETFVNNKKTDEATLKKAGVNEDALNAVKQANAEKLTQVNDIVDMAENTLGKKVSDEDIKQVIKSEYDTSRMDAMKNELENPDIAESVKNYQEKIKELKGQKGKSSLTRENMLKADSMADEIRTLETSDFIPGNDDMTRYLNAVMYDNDIQTNSKQHLLENLTEVNRALERLENSKNADEIASILQYLEKHDREVKMINSDPNFKNLHHKNQEIKAREVASLADMDRLERKYRTFKTASGELSQTRRRPKDVTVGNWTKQIKQDLGLPDDIKVKDFEGYIPKHRIDDVRAAGEGNYTQIEKYGSTWYQDAPVADLEYEYKGDRYFFKGSVNPETGKWEGESFVARKQKDLKPLPKVGEKAGESAELKAKKKQYKEFLKENGIDDEKLYKTYKEIFELQEEIDFHLKYNLDPDASLESYFKELDNYNNSELKVDNKKLSELVTRENSEADLGYKKTEVELENELKYNDDVIGSDPELKEIQNSINKALSEGEFSSKDDSTKSGLAQYIMCKLGG